MWLQIYYNFKNVDPNDRVIFRRFLFNEYFAKTNCRSLYYRYFDNEITLEKTIKKST